MRRQNFTPSIFDVKYKIGFWLLLWCASQAAMRMKIALKANSAFMSITCVSAEKSLVSFTNHLASQVRRGTCLRNNMCQCWEAWNPIPCTPCQFSKNNWKKIKTSLLFHVPCSYSLTVFLDGRGWFLCLRTFCPIFNMVRVLGCDEQEDCPEGEFCIYVNHMCQCWDQPHTKYWLNIEMSLLFQCSYCLTFLSDKSGPSVRL